MKSETVEEREKRLQSHVIGNNEDDDMTYYDSIDSFTRFLPPIELAGVKFYMRYGSNNALQWAIVQELRKINEKLKEEKIVPDPDSPTKDLEIRIEALEKKVNIMFNTLDKMGIREIAELVEWWKMVTKLAAEQKKSPTS